MKPYLLYAIALERESPGELEAAQAAFGADMCGFNVNEIPPGSLVVPRWRALPFGRELEAEVTSGGSTLVNSYHEHRLVANLFNYVQVLEGLTAPAYRIDELAYLPEGAYFLKGETNSLKNDWFGSAYAPTKRAVIDVASRISKDGLVGSQELVIRPFRSYRKLCEAVDGRPVFNERRVFTYRGEVLSDGFYWSSFVDDVGEVSPLIEGEFERTLGAALERLRDHTPFVVIDMAEFEDGSWEVVELNDGSMSGLSENDPSVLWTNFVNAIGKD